MGATAPTIGLQNDVGFVVAVPVVENRLGAAALKEERERSQQHSRGTFPTFPNVPFTEAGVPGAFPMGTCEGSDVPPVS